MAYYCPLSFIIQNQKDGGKVVIKLWRKIFLKSFKVNIVITLIKRRLLINFGILKILLNQILYMS